MKAGQNVTLFMTLGIPGAGKTFFARQFSDTQNIALLDLQHLRHILFEEPNYTNDEDNVVRNLADYMADQFLNSGISVIYDGMNSTRVRRHELREKARKYKARPLVVWVQTDANTAYDRAKSRDRRNPNDKYAQELDGDEFDKEVSRMKTPKHEDYVVISGKHVFANQNNAVIRKVIQMHSPSADGETPLSGPRSTPNIQRSRPRIH